MKNRRIVLVCFLLVAAMTIGIGYAALTDKLYVSGEASIDVDNAQVTFNGDVYFSKAVASEGRATTEITADEDSNTKDLVKITVATDALQEVGDEVVVTLTVKSESDLPAYITLNPVTVDGENPTYFAVTCLPTGHAATEVVPIAPNGTVDYVVTIKQVSTPTTSVSCTFAFNLDVTTDAPQSNA